MAVQKRKCASCRYFQSAQLAGNGWCTHPKRQTSSDVRVLVRKDELACRNSWGSDLWVSATAPDSNTPEQPAAQLTEDIVIPPQKLDDVIESVVASDFAERPSTPASDDDDASAEDVVVGEASLVPEQRELSLPNQAVDEDDLAGINTAAHNDQAHRAQVIARGSLDAILQARERVQRRRGVNQPSTPHAAGASDVPQPVSEDVQSDATQSQEAPANQEQRSPLERQRVQFGRAYNDPTPPVPVSETRGDERESDPSGYDADIFDSVPEIDPDVELPHIDEATRRRIEQEQAASDEFEGPGEILPEEQLSSYELVLQRARAIRAAARAERDLRPARGGATHKGGRQTSKRTPQHPSRQEQRHEAMAVPATIRPVEDVPEQPKLEAKASLPTEARAVADPEVEDHSNPGTRFDMNLLITQDVSFRRQRRTDTQPSLDSQSDTPVAEDLDTPEESVLPVPRRVPFFRRWKSPSARGQVEEYPAVGTVSDTRTPDDVAADTPAESQDWDGAALQIPDDEPVPALDEPAADDPDETGQAITPVSEDVQASFGSGHPRDLYGYRREDSSSSRERRDDEMHPVSPEPASSHWTRSDYRIRASRHAESPTLPDIDVGEDSDYQDLDTAPPVEDRYVLPLTEEQESTGGNDWSASWSFEPQTNLREADAMDAFRARLFGKTSAVREARPAAANFAPAADTRTESVRTSEPAARTAVASLQRSPLRASSFSRPERPDNAEGELVTSQSANVAPRVNRLDTLIAEADAAIDADLDFDQMPDADPDFDIRDVLAHHGDLLDMTIGLAPELPRACRTCRDYRPAENGDRGWCANTYAFTHRQMVNADDLACQSTIGCWWLPYDEIWLPEEPVSTPTPRVAKMVTDGTGRKRSG